MGEREAGHLDENVEDLRRGYRRRRDRMLDSLAEHMPAGADWSEPDGGFFVWIRFPEGTDAETLLPEAVEEGVSYLPGSLFYPDGGIRPHARLSFSHVSPAEIDHGVEALATALASASPHATASDD